MRILAVLILIFFAFKSSGTGLQPYVVTYDKDDYNASSKNWSVDVNSQGLVYVGNHEGLLEGDGQTWKLYKLPAGGIVRSVAIDKNDRIYTGSFEEFGYWEADETGLLQYTSVSDKLSDYQFHNEDIWKIIIRDKLVYFQSFSKIFVFNQDSVNIIDPGTNIIFLLKAGESLVAQNVNVGLGELKNGKFTPVKNSEYLKDAEVKVLLPYKENSYLLGSGTRGLYIWQNGKFKIWDCEAQQSLADKQINHGLYRNGLYYIGTITDGVYIFDENGNIIEHLNTSSALLNNTILGMCFDANGNLWLNHDKGLSFVSFNYPYKTVVSSNNKLGALHTAILFDHKLYLGTNQGLYYTSVAHSDLSNVRLDDFIKVEGSQGQVLDLRVIDNQLICGHNNGTYRVEGDKLINISPVTGGFCIKRFTDDMLIQSTYTNMILYKKDEMGKWHYFKTIEDFVEPVKYIETDFRGNIWASHFRKGFYKLKLTDDYSRVIPSETEYYGKNEGFTTEPKTHVFKLDNRIVFTSGKGIYTYDDLKDSIILYNDLNKQLGLFEDAERIVKAPKNMYWFIHSEAAGLFHVTENRAELILQINLDMPGFHLVEESPNVVPLNENEHLVCLEDGFILINPNRNNGFAEKNPVLIREIKIEKTNFRLPLKNNANIPVVPYKNNSLSFAFSPVIFPGTGNRFSVKLEGLNKDWSPYSENSTINYSRLPWGEYTFRVKGINEFGKLLPEASYKFEISPPWYATNYAYVGYFLLIISSFIIFPLATNRYFRKQKEEFKAKQERIFREKQKEQELIAERKIVKLRNQQLQRELESKSRELASNAMVIMKRNETLTEIRQELEKQKELLGSRFPNKNYEKITRLIDRNISNEEEWRLFEENFDQAHNNFFKRLKKEYPLLTPSDLRLCAYLYLNLTSKEIAPLLNISIRGVEIHRYRLRKKLELSTDENLVEFIMQF